MSKMWLLRHKKGRSSHNCCLYQFFKIYFENKILKNENFDHPEKNELFCLQTNLFVKNSFYMTILYEQTYFLPFLRLSYKYLHFFTEWWDDGQDQCNGQKCVFDSSFIIPLIMIL